MMNPITLNTYAHTITAASFLILALAVIVSGFLVYAALTHRGGYHLSGNRLYGAGSRPVVNGWTWIAVFVVVAGLLVGGCTTITITEGQEKCGITAEDIEDFNNTSNEEKERVRGTTGASDE